MAPDIPYRLVKSKRRRVAISVGPTGEVVVKAPKWASDRKVSEIVSSMSDWIDRKREKAGRTMSFVRESGVNRENLMYMGRLVRMEVLPAASRESLSFDGSRFVAKLRKFDERSVERLYIRWLKRNAAAHLEDSIRRYQKALGVSVEKLTIRNQKTRWGSASRNGTVSFNCNLLKAPPEVADYVVAHELCHLRVPNHSRKFWELVGSLVPEYRKMRKWLRDNGTPLMDLSKF